MAATPVPTQNALLHFEAFGPDEAHGALVLTDPETGASRLLTGPDERIFRYTRFDFSSVARQVAYIAPDPEGRLAIYVVNINGENRRRVSQEGVEAQVALSWSADGEEIAFIRDGGPGSVVERMRGRAHAIHVATGDEHLMFPDLDEGQGCVQWSSTGLVALGVIAEVDDQDDFEIDILVLEPGARKLIARIATKGSTCSMAWSPDGRRMAYIEDSVGRLYVLDTRSGETVAVTYMTRVWDAGWALDGNRIVMSIDMAPGSALFVAHIDGTGVRNVGVGPGFEVSGTWSPDGTRIAFLVVSPEDFLNLTEIGIADLESGDSYLLTEDDIGQGAPRWIAWAE